MLINVSITSFRESPRQLLVPKRKSQVPDWFPAELIWLADLQIQLAPGGTLKDAGVALCARDLPGRHELNVTALQCRGSPVICRKQKVRAEAVKELWVTEHCIAGSPGR